MDPDGRIDAKGRARIRDDVSPSLEVPGASPEQPTVGATCGGLIPALQAQHRAATDIRTTEGLRLQAKLPRGSYDEISAGGRGADGRPARGGVDRRIDAVAPSLARGRQIRAARDRRSAGAEGVDGPARRIEDQIAAPRGDVGIDVDIARHAGVAGRLVGALERHVDRPVGRRDRGRQIDRAVREDVEVDRAEPAVADAARGSNGHVGAGPHRAGQVIQGERTRDADGRGKGQRGAEREGAGGQDSHARTGVDRGLDVRRLDVGQTSVRQVARERPGRAGRGDGDVRGVEEPRATDAGLDDARKFEDMAGRLDAAAEGTDVAGDGGDAVCVGDIGPKHDFAALPCVDHRTGFERGGQRLTDAV